MAMLDGNARRLVLDRDRIIAELRAVLAPLLDNPVIDGEASYPYCVLCKEYEVEPQRIAHAPDCPVLRKDDLLGRTSTGAENSVDSR